MSTFIPYAYFSLLFMLSFSITRIRSAFPYYCPNTTTYNPNSTYRSNLNQLLTTLSSNASRGNGFYNYTIGRGPPDTVYGLFQCRGDVQTSVCEHCVKTATTELLQNCPKEKRATIWYENCTLRFSNESIFSMGDLSYTVWSFNPDNITEEPNRFRKLVRQTMNEIEAVAATSDKKFATKIVNFTSYRKLYTLAQCTQDLSTADCHTCLQSLISKLGQCCDNKGGGRVITQSCNIRYESYAFFESIPPPAPPPTANIPPIRPPPVSPSTTNQGNGGISKQDIIAIIIVPISVSLVLFFVGYFYLTRRTRKKPYDAVNDENDEPIEISWVESLQYDLNTIMIATNNFSADNKIGEGGFGSVYKGTFSNGQEIAVKRLSKNSTQGTKEFKNEVMVVAKLQHRNLVRLLGFCLEAEERILIYEFVPNKSLDYFLFDPEKRQMLNWLKRYHIIGGIARGLVYLHEDSRLRIIHRDLKASNILLDGDMNPKISDFGMARIFGVDQSQQNTSRIAGTYGYMSPEYVMYGQISIKSDVFSFGVLVLEIISGKKNNSFHRSDGSDNLISYAWNLWRNNRPLELMDLTMQNNYSENEVIRCIQIGLLCVQEDVDDRPNMPSILLALNSTFLTPLDVPRHPAFVLASTTSTTQRSPRAQNLDNSTSTSTAFSTNEASVSQLYPR